MAPWTCNQTEQEWDLTADTVWIRNNMLQSSKHDVRAGQASKPEALTVAYDAAWAEARSTTPPDPAVRDSNLCT